MASLCVNCLMSYQLCLTSIYKSRCKTLTDVKLVCINWSQLIIITNINKVKLHFHFSFLKNLLQHCYLLTLCYSVFCLKLSNQWFNCLSELFLNFNDFPISQWFSIEANCGHLKPCLFGCHFTAVLSVQAFIDFTFNLHF